MMAARVILTPKDPYPYSRDQMRKRCVLFGLIAAMLVSVVGVRAQHQGSCPLTSLPDCCKKARSHGPEASMARLCCNLNCSEPGSTGSSSSRFSTQQLSSADTAIILNAAQFSFRIVFPRQPQQLHVRESNPKYITHLALLI